MHRSVLLASAGFVDENKKERCVSYKDTLNVYKQYIQSRNMSDICNHRGWTHTN